MRHFVGVAALLLLLASSAGASNLFDVAASTKLWIRASALCIRDEPIRPVLSTGIGFALASKTSGTLQYRVVFGDANQFEFGITRAIW
jgi:hypothetical protein